MNELRILNIQLEFLTHLSLNRNECCCLRERRSVHGCAEEKADDNDRIERLHGRMGFCQRYVNTGATFWDAVRLHGCVSIGFQLYGRNTIRQTWFLYFP